jgi:hypothetical protein
MSQTFRLALVAGAFAAQSFAPVALRAQAAPAAQSAAPDSIAFPRQFVNWVFTSQGDSAFAHAAPLLRERMKSAAGVNEMAAQVLVRFGESKGTEAEIKFDEEALKVYIVVMRFSLAPEPGAFDVVSSPSTKVVERSSFSSLTNIKSRYPQAKLP